MIMKKRISVYVSDQLYVNLQLAAIESGLSISALVRSLILDGSGWGAALLRERRRRMNEILLNNKK
jgi:hypothetical protein